MLHSIIEIHDFMTGTTKFIDANNFRWMEDPEGGHQYLGESLVLPLLDMIASLFYRAGFKITWDNVFTDLDNTMLGHHLVNDGDGFDVIVNESYPSDKIRVSVREIYRAGLQDLRGIVSRRLADMINDANERCQKE